MKFITAAEMKGTDQVTVEQYGGSWAALMEQAGAAVARFVQLQWPRAKRIALICGKGNNGGDGFVAARLLAEAGLEVTVVLLGDPAKLKGDAANNFRKLSMKPLLITDAPGLARSEVGAKLAAADVIVDAIYGTGFRPPLDALTQALKQLVDGISARAVAVDLPSGWDADSRGPRADAFRADAVVTFTAPKTAHAFGDMTGGPIVVAQIGSPNEAIASDSQLHWTGSALAKFQQPRDRNGNKGQYGHVLVVGGARGKSGAPSMSSLASMRVGAGLTTAAITSSILSTVAAVAPELMTAELKQTTGGAISAANATSAAWKALLEKKSVLAMGPGLGESAETQKFVHSVVAHREIPLVLDADGLNAFAGHTDKLNGKKDVLVLTPHPGEMARLLGSTVKAVEADRENMARKFATEHELILVLKGWRTLVAHPDGRTAVNLTGNPGMAKGGSGDVLTGLVAGMLSQAKAYGATDDEAVEAAVHLHGLAADMAVATGDEHTFLPTDLLHWLPRAFQLRNNEPGGFTWLRGFPPGALRSEATPWQ
jgi:NAD(P)H-hydrate epimerase